jgi:hypothetical protein
LFAVVFNLNGLGLNYNQLCRYFSGQNMQIGVINGSRAKVLTNRNSLNKGVAASSIDFNNYLYLQVGL